MSYSFSIKAPTKAAAKEVVAAEFDKVVANQSAHARDRAAVIANAGAVIDLLVDDDTKDVHVSCNGYLTWNGIGSFDPPAAALTSASVGCAASLRDRA